MKISNWWYLAIPIVIAFIYFLSKYENHWIEGHYTATRSSRMPRNLQVHSFIKNSMTAPAFTDDTFVDFFRNGTYVMNWHHFEYGTYELEDSIVVMTNQNDETWHLRYERDDSTGVRTFAYPHPQDGTYERPFKMKYRKNRNDSSYPFTLKNNRWRIKAEEDLTKNEIIDRLQNMIGYYIKCVEWSNEERFKFKFYSTPSPLRASGYFFVARSKRKSDKWCEFFHNPDDCDESLEIIRQFLRENKLEWHNSINGYLRILAALKHLQEGVGQYRE